MLFDRDMLQHILLIQDDPSDARAVERALTDFCEKRFEITWVRSCLAGLEHLRQGAAAHGPGDPAIAAILVDLALPDSQGIETFHRLIHAAAETPILVLCATEDEEVANLAVRLGAQDYLLKSKLDNYLLPKAVRSMMERAAKAEALFEDKERAQVTLNSIGDGVISTDLRGNVTYLNAAAESMSGWSLPEASGQPFEQVFQIIDISTGESTRNPMVLAMKEDRTVALTPNCVLIRRDGIETAIEDSASAIHDRRGQVTGAVMVFHDVSKARAVSLRISHLAQHDTLTDLPNRILLKDRISQAITAAQRYQHQLAVLFLDLDNFKQINDSLGHDTGDRVLQWVAHRLLSCVRSADTVSRQGGDEFIILLSEVKCAQDADVCAETILSALSLPARIDQHDLYLSASIGIATYPGDGTDADTIMKHADRAMYHAKSSGSNTYKFFESSMNGRAVERQSLENGLRQAIDREQFVLHYQPRINLLTGAIVGVEALLRWHHPQRGLIFPGQFMAIAEESGLIVPIGRWVLREGCRQGRVWQDAGLPKVRVAINISAVELRARNFLAGVDAVLSESGFAPRDLEVELTETFLMQDTKAIAAILQELKNIGVRITLDDFGTGYASLSHLRRLPIDTLKIDQSFIGELTVDAGNASNASIVSAIINMGRGLRMQVVAEGVETRKQFESLRQQACPEGQGFLFSPPIAAEDFAQILARGLSTQPSSGEASNGVAYPRRVAINT